MRCLRRAPLTVVEIAAFLGVTPGAVRKQIRAHGIKPLPVKFGRRVQYDGRAVFKVMGTHDRRAR